MAVSNHKCFIIFYWTSNFKVRYGSRVKRGQFIHKVVNKVINAAKMVSIIKELGGVPFLTDSNTLYSGRRSNAIDHLQDQHVVETQNLLDIEVLPHVDGENIGFVWDRESIWDRPIQPYVKGTPRPRHPAWDNYLKFANVVKLEMEKDGVVVKLKK